MCMTNFIVPPKFAGFDVRDNSDRLIEYWLTGIFGSRCQSEDNVLNYSRSCRTREVFPVSIGFSGQFR